MIQLDFPDPDRASDDPQATSYKDALRHLTVGSAVLLERQSEPPWPVLEYLEERVEDIGVFGPPVTGSRLITKVQTNLFVNGDPQYIAEGIAISWFVGSKALKAAAEAF